ncbi:MAG: alkaline shock response membrane anchor protein AmaP [Dethiobacter sp.]|jgi:uncharacterized alkaline shock family protein YloU|nr:alkaline shock response membrane anchor protein AmaP [Dethiobacter sp.]MBS3898148.1 alkaline shock response membrane anchor protein AmaP [Dethiobacter sp.]MBS3983703.1 alkaline shock response membrane anchor protein AmaP [Dethiobacter sp.]MCL4464071.1 alkaline shock response membrane anchor protein AmaP [Bacillota bacterium]MCL5993086.1 alkaline shock response membrane anchor protein AmaP [Bacillota bacterium]
MTTGERIYLCLLALSLAAAGIVLGAVATAYFPLDFLRTSLEAVYGNRNFIVLAGVMILLAVAVMVAGLRRSERVETILLHGPLGEVRICFKAVENMVLKASKSIKGIREIKTKIVFSDNGVVIFLRAVIYPEQIIPQLTAELQAVVKDDVEKITGSSVAEVRVMIENIVTDGIKTAH